MITDPRFAPKRTDLPFLQRRRLPRQAAPQPVEPPVPTAAGQDRPDAASTAVHEFLSGAATRPRRHRPAEVPVPGPEPAAPVAPPAAPTTAATSSLDLDAPAAPATPAPPPPTAAGASLDLGGIPEPPAPILPTAARRARPVARVRAGGRHIMSVAAPTVTFSRLQSGIGALEFEAACGEQVGDLRLGALYELSDGYASSLQLTEGARVAPPRSRRPVLVAGHDRFEQIAIDNRQNRALRRLAVYAFSPSRQPLSWGGTLIVQSLGGARVELPLDGLPPQDTAVLMSLYNVEGEYVVRAEMQAVVGGPRAAAAAFGYDRITWLDDRTPVD